MLAHKKSFVFLFELNKLNKFFDINIHKVVNESKLIN